MDKDVSMLGTFGSTVRVVSSDTAQYLPSTVIQYLVNTDLNDYSVGVMISVETYDVRIAWRTTPTTTVGHILAVGDVLRIKGRDNILKLRFINKTVGENGVLQITPEYSK